MAEGFLTPPHLHFSWVLSPRGPWLCYNYWSISHASDTVLSDLCVLPFTRQEPGASMAGLEAIRQQEAEPSWDSDFGSGSLEGRFMKQ